MQHVSCWEKNDKLSNTFCIDGHLALCLQREHMGHMGELSALCDITKRRFPNLYMLGEANET